MPLIANKLFYIHIPKTSGTSLYANLLRQGVNIEKYFFTDKNTDISPHHYHLDILPKKYNQYKKFTIVRNPWERTMSAYFYRNQKQKTLDLEHFNKWLACTFIRFEKNNSVWDNHFRPQVEFVDDNVKVFLFNNLKECHDWVCNQLNIPNNFSAHKLKNKVVLDHTTPQELLSRDLYQTWLNIYKNDILLYDQLTS